jgi:hypothetical protein
LTCIGTWYADRWLDVFDGAREDLDLLFVGNLFLDDGKRVVKHVLRHALLASVHQAVDELAGQERPVLGIGLE